MSIDLKFPSKLKPFIIKPSRYNVLEGGRGGGKTWSVADFLLGIEGLRSSKRILCGREIQRSIKDSSHRILSDKIIQRGYPYEITERSIKSKINGTEFLFAGIQDHTIDTIKSFEGVQIFWGDESQMFSKRSLDILIPTIRTPDSYFIFTLNRYMEMDPVYERFCAPLRDNVTHIHLNYYDNPWCPSVLVDEAERCKQENYQDYLHIWEGQPISQGDSCVISLDKIKAATTRNASDQGEYIAGIDVARFGDDQTVITIRKGLKVIKLETYRGLRGYEIVDRFDSLCDGFNCIVKVDDTGVGGAVTDELHRRGRHTVVPVNNGQNAMDQDKYSNAINEMWFEFAKMIDEVSIPNDPELIQQLSSRRYTFDKAGRRCIEDKASFKKRFGKSPDLADSLLLCFYNHMSNVSVSFF